jgi:hypothetical protein
MIGFKNGVEAEENNVVRGFSSDTEVKTNHGWKLISQVDPEQDMILVAETDTREISYAQPLQVTVAPYEGTLMHLETRQVNLMLTDKTPLHLVRKHTSEGRCIYTPQQAENAGKKKNGDLLPLSGFRYHNGNEMEFILPAITVTKRKKEVTYPERRIDMKCWLEFFGFWLADGCCRGPLSSGKTLYAVFIKQKEDNGDYVLSLLRNIGFTPRVEHYKAKGYNNYCIYDRQLWEYLRQFGKSEDKYIPEEFLSLAPEYLEALFRGYINGDGKECRTCKVLSSRSKRLLDNVQELVLKLEGKVTQARKEYYTVQDGSRRWVWVIDYSMNERKRKNYTCYGEAKCVDYKGDVCGLQIEPGKVMLLRRNNTIMWAAC